MQISVIAAICSNGGIGYQGKIPWDLPRDRSYFRQLTISTTDPLKRNAVVMGRKTWESLNGRVLPQRVNVVISNTLKQQDLQDSSGDLHVMSSLDAALSFLENKVENVFIIGGNNLYKEAINRKDCRRLYITSVDIETQCDTFFPKFYHLNEFKLQNTTHFKENNIPISFEVWVRHSGEYQYLHLVHKALKEGNVRTDRTGTGTLSLFGESMRFDLREGFPLLTTKKVFWRGVVEELLWFIRGSTNVQELKDKNVNIWNENGSRKYLDMIGLKDRKEGDLGPIYGFQWRHFGAVYRDCHTDYTNEGVDQLQYIINGLRTDPFSRRHVMVAWNPKDLPLVALPSCHTMCQFYVTERFTCPNELSCIMYQRSGDLGLGVPMNIASYALLTHMIAHVVGMTVGELVICIADAHIYKNHVEELKRQINNVPQGFPKLKINGEVKDIDGFKWEDFQLIDYNPKETIKLKMAL